MADNDLALSSFGYGNSGRTIKGAYNNASNDEAKNLTRKFFTFMNHDVLMGHDVSKEPVIDEKALRQVDRNDGRAGKSLLQKSLSAYDFQVVFGKKPSQSAKDKPMSIYDFSTQVLGAKYDARKDHIEITRDAMYTRLKDPVALQRLKDFMGEQ